MWWIPILVATWNICKNRLAYRHYLSGYCEKYAQSTVFSFSKVDSVTRLGLSQNLKNGVWLRRFAEGVLVLWQLQENFWVSFYNKFAGFSKWWGKYLSKRSLIKRTWSWRVNFLAKLFLRIENFTPGLGVKTFPKKNPTRSKLEGTFSWNKKGFHKNIKSPSRLLPC